MKWLISEHSNLAQEEFKTKQPRVGKMIHRELSKSLKFVFNNKWFKYLPTPPHKGNFLAKFNWFEFRVFLLDQFPYQGFSLPNNLPIDRGRIVGFMPFPKIICAM